MMTQGMLTQLKQYGTPGHRSKGGLQKKALVDTELLGMLSTFIFRESVIACFLYLSGTKSLNFYEGFSHQFLRNHERKCQFSLFLSVFSFRFFGKDYCPQCTYQRGGLAHRSSQSDIEQGLCSEGPWGLFGFFKVWWYNVAEDWVDNLLLSYSSVSTQNHWTRGHKLPVYPSLCYLPRWPDRPSTCTDPYLSVCTSDCCSEYRWTRSMASNDILVEVLTIE